MTGYVLNQIIAKAIDYKEKNVNQSIWMSGVETKYDNSREHKNVVISDTLNLIDNIILFKPSNYFLRFSTEYTKFHVIEDSFENDWYEYVEYGSTNKLTIYLQRNGSQEKHQFIEKTTGINVFILMKLILSLINRYLIVTWSL